MPWKASSVMEERLRFVPRLLDGEARHARWTGKYPWRPGRMARRRTCNLQHSMFGRQVRSTMVDVRSDTLPQDLVGGSVGASSARNAAPQVL